MTVFVHGVWHYKHVSEAAFLSMWHFMRGLVLWPSLIARIIIMFSVRKICTRKTCTDNIYYS